MKYLLLLCNRIKAFWEDNRLYFASILILSVVVEFIVVIGYTVSVPSVAARTSEEQELKTFTIELTEKDSVDQYNQVVEIAKAHGEVSTVSVLSAVRDKEKVRAISSNTFVSQGDDYYGRLFFTPEEEEQSAKVAIVTKNEKCNIGDTIENSFGTFTVVGKSRNMSGPVAVLFSTFFEINDCPGTVQITFCDILSAREEKALLDDIYGVLPGHYVSHTGMRYIENESTGIIRIMAVVVVLSFLVVMSAFEYSDCQNSSQDILLRMTGASKSSVIILSSICKIIFMIFSSVIALLVYDILVLAGLKEIPLFGKTVVLVFTDHMLIIVLSIAAAVIAAVPYMIKNYITTPKELAQKKD